MIPPKGPVEIYTFLFNIGYALTVVIALRGFLMETFHGGGKKRTGIK